MQATGTYGTGMLLVYRQYYRCKKLREEVNNHELINAKKDTTRPSNVYYGLNWGYRSDETVSKYD